MRIILCTLTVGRHWRTSFSCASTYSVSYLHWRSLHLNLLESQTTESRVDSFFFSCLLEPMRKQTNKRIKKIDRFALKKCRIADIYRWQPEQVYRYSMFLSYNRDIIKHNRKFIIIKNKSSLKTETQEHQLPQNLKQKLSLFSIIFLSIFLCSLIFLSFLSFTFFNHC
jgi:hypothetical protein